MEKLTQLISPEEWGSLVTKYKPSVKRVKIADFTDGTINADTDVTGNITKREGGPNYNPIALPAAPKDQFEAIFSDGARHLLVAANGEIRYSSGDTVFNTIVNGTGFSAGANFEFSTTQDRVYAGNGVNSPIVYDRSTAYGGVVYTAPRIKTMGAQAPGSAPTAGAPTAGGNVPNGAHTYKVTFLYYDSEESNGSPASGIQTAGAGNNTIPLTAIPVGGYGVTARKIYRDNNDGLYLHIATLTDNTTTTFNDTVNVGATPTEIPEFNNTPPTFALIEEWLDRQWLGKVPGDPFTLFYTETSMPDIVRPENQVLCNQEDPITAYIVYFGRLIVFNRRSMGQILGTTSDQFRYSAIPSSIGCVDNRSLQTRVIEGVPVLVWLSDRGFYSYDGNSINYISKEIEDLVNFNIQQATQQQNSNAQSSQAQFTSGTSSPGIDLTSVPGSITTRGYLDGSAIAGTNPRRDWNEQSDWEGAGTDNTNTVTRDGTNTVKVPTRFRPSAASGTRTGDAQIVSGTVQLPTSVDWTGETKTGDYNPGILNTDTNPNGIDDLATPFIVPRAGNLTSFTFQVKMRSGVATAHPRTWPVHLEVWTDAAGLPGGSIHSTVLNPTFPTQSGTFEFTLTTGAISVALSANIRYWFVIRLAPGQNAGPGVLKISNAHITTSQYNNAGGFSWARHDEGAWDRIEHSNTNDLIGLAAGSYTFSPTLVSRTGSWLSPVHNNNSVFTASGLTIDVAGGSLTAGQTAILRIEGSDDGVNFDATQDFSLVNGSQNLLPSGSFDRYWRIRLLIATNDDRFTPIVYIDNTTILTLRFNTTSTWISDVIDMSSDVTTYDFLTVVSTIPSGTTLTTTIATSTDNITYSSFVAFGSHVVRRYAKIRVVLTASSGDILTPTLTSISFGWTLVSNLISSAIDTAVAPPAGWDIFLASFLDNGGTVQFQMRSASTLGGLTAATFFNVTPGDFPAAVTPLQFVQWKVILTASNNDVPIVDSVTVQWFITLAASLRPASIFVESRYYIALAGLGETFNNILLELDLDGKWRRHSGLPISTFSFFFNRPYLGLATSGIIRKFLEGYTDNGSAIEFDVRFKALDFSTQYQNNSAKVKTVGEVILQGINTGATLQLFYSVDNGETFYPMYTPTGASSYTTTTDGSIFYVRFRPVWDGSVPFAGRTIMYRIYNNDINFVEIIGLEGTAFARLQSPVITG